MSKNLLHSQKYPLKEVAKIPIAELANLVYYKQSFVPVRCQHDRKNVSLILCFYSMQV